jgi:hypothetical protein
MQTHNRIMPTSAARLSLLFAGPVARDVVEDLADHCDRLENLNRDLLAALEAVVQTHDPSWGTVEQRQRMNAIEAERMDRDLLLRAGITRRA